jgi:hypothetical protein
MNRSRRRWILAIISALIVGLSVVYAVWMVHRANQAPIDTVPLNDAMKSAVSLRLEAAKSVFQVGLLVFGALFGLVFASEKRRISLTDKPELCLFVVGTLAMLLSFLSYLRYSFELSVMQADAAVAMEKLRDETPQGSTAGSEKLVAYVPDFFGERIDVLLSTENLFLVVGCVVAALTFISVTFLKKEEPI